MLCSHGVVGKSVWWEEAVRVPLLVRLPVPAGVATAARVWRTPVSLVDVTPTLLGLCGVPAADALRCPDCGGSPVADGRDLSASLSSCLQSGHTCRETGGDPWRRFGSLAYGWVAAATASVKVLAVALNGTGHRPRLKLTACFNLEVDPFEMQSLPVTMGEGASRSATDRACSLLARALMQEAEDVASGVAQNASGWRGNRLKQAMAMMDGQIPDAANLRKKNIACV